MAITLSDIEQVLASGWLNKLDVDLSRLVQAGQTVTIVISDGSFTVPDPLPGGANVIAQKQHTFGTLALLVMRVLTRAD